MNKIFLPLVTLMMTSLSLSAQIPVPYGSTIESYSGNSWDSSLVSSFTYDAVDRLISVTSKRWNAVTMVWDNESRREYDRNSDGNVTMESRFTWSKPEQKWKNSTRLVYSYYDSAKVSSVGLDFYNNGWFHLSLDSNFYNASGSIEVKKTYWWNAFMNVFDYLGRHHYNYDSGNILRSSLYEWLDTTSTTWDSINLYHYGYNSMMHVDTQIRSVYDPGSGWVYETRVISAFNITGDLLVNRETFEFNEISMEWDNNTKTEYTYYPDGRRDTEVSSLWNVTELFYEFYSRTTYHYASPAGILSNRDDLSFVLFPNPVVNELHLVVPDNALGSSLHIVAADGRILFDRIINNTLNVIDTRQWIAGVYVAIVENGKQRYQLRFVRQ